MPALVAGREFHSLPVFGYGSAGQVDAMRLQDNCDVLVAEGMLWIFFSNQSGDFRLQFLFRVAAASFAGEEVGRGEEPLPTLDILMT